jgi:hypothetical protein
MAGCGRWKRRKSRVDDRTAGQFGSQNVSVVGTIAFRVLPLRRLPLTIDFESDTGGTVYSRQRYCSYIDPRRGRKELVQWPNANDLALTALRL